MASGKLIGTNQEQKASECLDFLPNCALNVDETQAMTGKARCVYLHFDAG